MLKSFDVPADLLGPRTPAAEVTAEWTLAKPTTVTVTDADGEPLARPPSAVVVSGRRSGKTYAYERMQAVWALSEPENSAVQVPWRACGGHYWVCPVCCGTDTWWTVQLCDGLDQPPMIAQFEMVKAAAMNHLFEEWETHSEWCLDFLEMAKPNGGL